jgi:glycosyltransferase involved in cell wall biosynthesis
MSKNSSKVSIVLPTYNGAKYIRQSIDSCLNQTYKNLELIIVDDGSSDKTPEIIKSYKDKRIKYIQHKKNKGLPFALNTGFANTIGEYLTWTSDDNQYLSEAIEKMLNYLNSDKKIDFVYADYFNYILETGEKLLVKVKDSNILVKENVVGPCFLYSRTIYKNIGNYNAKYFLVEDYEYWIRVFKKYSLVHYPYPLYIYRSHSKSLTNNSYWEVILFDSILKYQNNFITLHELAKKIIFFFINIVLNKRGNFIEIIFKDYLRILKISFRLSILYLILFLYFLFYGGIKLLNKILKNLEYKK